LFGYASGRYFSSTKSGQTAVINTTTGATQTQPDTKTKNGDVFAKLTAQPTQSLQINGGFRALPTKTDSQFDSQFDAVTAGYETDDYDLIRETNGWGAFVRGATCPAVACGARKTGQIRARFYTLQPEQTGKARTYSAFLQDTISWKRLSVNVGVLFNKDDFSQVTLAGQRVNFMSFAWGDEVQPRVGVAYNAELLK